MGWQWTYPLANMSSAETWSFSRSVSGCDFESIIIVLIALSSSLLSRTELPVPISSKPLAMTCPIATENSTLQLELHSIAGNSSLRKHEEGLFVCLKQDLHSQGSRKSHKPKDFTGFSWQPFKKTWNEKKKKTHKTIPACSRLWIFTEFYIPTLPTCLNKVN